MSMADALLSEFDREMAITRRLLERVPEDRFSWRPHARSMSLGELAVHVASLPSWFKQKGHVLFTMPRAAAWRNFVLNHLVHHRGQLGVYLRLNEVPVPSMYGPSADEAPAF